MDRRAGLPAAHLVPQATLEDHRHRHPGANLLPQVAIRPHQAGANHHHPVGASRLLAGNLVDHRLPFLAHLREDHLLLPRLLRPHRAVKVRGREAGSHIPSQTPEGSTFRPSRRSHSHQPHEEHAWQAMPGFLLLRGRES